MRECIEHPIYGEIVYNETWTGKKSLSVNGVNATAISSKEFIIGDKKATLTGTLFKGVGLSIAGETIEISPKPKWYEMVLAVLPLLFVIIWSNSKSLCAIFPVVGGAIGGGLGGLAICLSMLLIKRADSFFEKITLALGVLVVTALISAALAMLLIAAI